MAYAVVETVSSWPLTAEAQLQFRTFLWDFFVDKFAVGFFFQVIRFFPVSIIPPVLHVH